MTVLLMRRYNQPYSEIVNMSSKDAMFFTELASMENQKAERENKKINREMKKAGKRK